MVTRVHGSSDGLWSSRWKKKPDDNSDFYGSDFTFDSFNKTFKILVLIRRSPETLKKTTSPDFGNQAKKMTHLITRRVFNHRMSSFFFCSLYHVFSFLSIVSNNLSFGNWSSTVDVRFVKLSSSCFDGNCFPNEFWAASSFFLLVLLVEVLDTFTTFHYSSVSFN